MIKDYLIPFFPQHPPGKCIKIEYSYFEIRIDVKCTSGCCLFLPFQFLDQNAKKMVERKLDQRYREKALHVNRWNRDLKVRMYQIQKKHTISLLSQCPLTSHIKINIIQLAKKNQQFNIIQMQINVFLSCNH
jgi:hypothetical protein